MKKILISTGIVAALVTSAIFAFGDIARPKSTPSKEPRGVLYTSLQVSTDAKSYEARLQIPRNVLQDIAKQAGNTSSTTSLGNRMMQSSTRTIMAGLFMFLAISFAGVWLARSNQRRNVKAVAAILAIGFMFGIATVMVRANAGPPASFYWQRLPQNLTQGKPTQAGVDVQILDTDDTTIKLIMPIKNSGKSGE
jgi:Ca2+-binding RTX toxin-like protein